MAARDQLLAEAAHEAEGYGRLGSRGRLLQSLGAHMKGHQQNLVVHASTACQPWKVPALVPDLLVAGLSDAKITSSEPWSCTLELPALFEPGDNHPYRVTLEARTRKEVVQDSLQQFYIHVHVHVYVTTYVHTYVRM